MAHVLFVCLHNAGRSQMSRALFDHVVEGRHTSGSAGTTPAERVHPEVVEVMQELGIDVSGERPQKLTAERAARADVVVTMGCGDQCPYVPGKRYIDWELPDPKGQPVEHVRAIRDEIRELVRRLADELDRQEPVEGSPAQRV
jgi:arsenate reductase (thioredoxin)